MTDKAADKPHRTAWRWFWRSLIIALALLIGGTAVLTATSSGLKLIAGMASGIARNVAGMELSIDDIEGSVWSRLRIGGLNLDGPDGLAVSARSLTFAWSPLSLLQSRLDIQEISAERIALDLPAASPAPVPEEPSEPFTLPGFGLRVETLDLPEISIRLPDNPDRLNLSATGTILRTAAGDTNTTFSVRPLAPGDDHIVLTARLSESDRTLDLTLDAVMATDGLFAQLAGLQELLAGKVTASVKGSGELSAWQGKLALSYGELLNLDSKIAANLSPTGNVTLDGLTDIRQPVELGLPALLQGVVSHHLALRLPDDETVELTSLTLSQPDRFDLTADATVKSDLSDIISTVDLRIDKSLSALAGPGIDWEDIFLTAAITGDIGNPAIDITASANALAIDGLMKADAGLSGRLTGTTDAPYRIDLSSNLSGITWSDGIPGELIGDKASLIIAATAEPDFSRFTLVDADIIAGDLSTNAKAGATADGTLSDAGLSLTYADLGKLQTLTGLPLKGRADIALNDLTGTLSDGFTGKLRVSAKGLKTGIPDVEKMIGEHPVITANLMVKADGNITLSDLSVKAGAVTLDGQTAFRADDQTISADFSGGLTAAGLPAIDAARFTSDPNFSLKLAGPAARPTGTVSLSLASMQAADMAITDVRLENRIGWTGDAPSVAVKLSGKIAGQPMTASGNLLAAASGLEISSLHLGLPGIDLKGDLRLPGNGPATTGKLRLDIRNGEAIAALAGVPVSLAGTSDIDLSVIKGQQVITTRSDITGLRLSDSNGTELLRLDQARLDARIDDALTTPRLTASLLARDLATDAGRIAVARLQAEGTPEALTFGLSAEGRFGKKVIADLTGSLALATPEITAVIDQGSVTFDGLETTVTESLRIVLRNGEPQAAGGKLSVAGGTITIGYQRARNSVDLTLNIAGVNVSPLAEVAEQKGLTGEINLDLKLNEVSSTVTGSMNLAVTSLGSDDFPNLDPIAVRLSGDLQNNRFRLDSNFDGIDLERTSLRADLPVRISLTTPSFSLAPGEPLSAEAVLTGELGRIWPLLPLPEHQMTGQFEIDAKANGTADKPELSGAVSVTDGNYEHLEFGTRLKAITLLAEFTGDQLVIRRFDATDGASGQLSVSGKAALGDGKPVFEAALEMTGLKLVHRDDLEVLASADIKTAGDETGGRITGGLTINRAEFNLNAALPPSVASVEIENDPNRKEKPEENAPAYPLALDLYLDVPGQAFIRGRGLDSEWAGRLDITGTAEQPIITGSLNAVRGQLDIVGKVFDIKKSAISFGGGVALDPKLSIAAVHTTTDLTVTAEVVGVASKPEIRLSSVPPLPRDEILSRVLFGTGKGNLGPLEAAQLAAAAAELSGATGSGPGILGRIRNVVGVDVLRVEDGSSGPAVAAGKYVAEGVYVGAKQGSKPGSSGVEVEVEITPNISVKSEAGQTGDSNIGLEFKWDY